jgi:hypothetical protein
MVTPPLRRPTSPIGLGGHQEPGPCDPISRFERLTIPALLSFDALVRCCPHK